MADADKDITSRKSFMAEVRTARQHFNERLLRMAEVRSTWESGWSDVLSHVAPEFDRVRKGDRANRGDVSWNLIMDGEPTLAGETFAEGVSNGMTNPSRRWFLGRYEDPAIAQMDESETWQDEVTSLMLEGMTRDAFYEAKVQFDYMYGHIGTAAMIGEDNEDGIINWLNLVPGEYYLGVNSKGVVDTCYREFELTAGQIIEKFGIRNVSESVKNAHESNNRKQKFTVIHAIEPVDGTLPEIDHQLPPQMKWRSVYFEQGSKTSHDMGYQDKFLDVSGYYEFPVVTARMGVVGLNPYGYGRGHKALADIKQLMYWSKLIDRAAELEVDPPLNEPASQQGKWSTEPGARNTYNDTNGVPKTHRTFEGNFNIEHAQSRVEVLKDRIRRFYYVDVFTLFTQSVGGPELRVDQVDQMRDEKLLRMGGVFQPQQKALDVVIDRYFGVMMRRGLLPPPPRVIAERGGNLNIEYQSIIAQAQRAQQVANIERGVAFAGQMLQLTGDAAAVDAIDSYEAVDQHFDAIGVPPKIVRTREAAEEIGRRRQAATMAQQAAMVAKDGAAAAKTMAETPVEGDNYLNAIAGAAG